MEMETIRINDNITLYYIPMEKLKTTSIGVYLHRPLCEGEVSENAVLPYVLKRGCKAAKDSEAVAKYLEELYGASFGAGVSKSGNDQFIHLGFETISDRYAAGGEKLTAELTRLAMSVLFEPVSFTDEVVEIEKKNAVDRIMSELNDKRIYARNRCIEEMFAPSGYALSAYGTKDGVMKITAQSLKAHYDKIITSTPIDIYVCGSADAESIADAVKPYVQGMEFTKAKLPKSEMLTGGENVKRVTDRMEVTQGKLCLGFKTGIAPTDSDCYALQVMCCVFGGGAHSKLFSNVREKLSLCYYASSNLLGLNGAMLVNAGIEFENFDKAYNEIMAQLDAVKNGDISDWEYVSSVKALVNGFEGFKDNQFAMQTFHINQRLAGLTDDIDAVKEKIKAVTVDDIKRAAEKIELNTVYFLTGKEE